MTEIPPRFIAARAETLRFLRFLVGRIYVLCFLLLAEYALLVSFPHSWSHLHHLVSACLVFAAVYLFLIPRRLVSYAGQLSIQAGWLFAHALCVGVVVFFHSLLLTQTSFPTAFIAAWYAGILGATLTLCLALLPIPAMSYVLRTTRLAAGYAAACSAFTALISAPVLALWENPTSGFTTALQRSTLQLVGICLRLFYPDSQVDPVTHIVTLPHFAVIVGNTCSGIEGLSLTLIFCIGWFWYARRELRFPQAFLVLPLALVLSYTFNIIRIVVVLAIGNAGHPDFAMVSFHSEAGWIAFNFIALTFLALTSRIPYFLRPDPTASVDTAHQAPQSNEVSVYLLPFLIILGTGFLTRAFSPPGVEWLYPLRLLACAAVFALYRPSYGRSRWNAHWLGFAAGVAVFVIWVPLAHRFIDPIPAGTPSTFAQALNAAPPIGRYAWLALRIVGATLFVPIAEELAFRGYLMRRLTSADFLSVRYGNVSILALALSSVAFGLMHGQLWLPGILAGLAFGFVARKTGRLTPAIVAHATTNLLLAIWVLTTHDWPLW